MINIQKINSSQIEILKYFAAFFMLFDHISKIVIPGQFYIFDLLGRVSFPIFSYIIVYNYIYNSKNKGELLKKLYIFSALVQPFYLYAFQDCTLNIIFTFTFALTIVYLYEKYSVILPKYKTAALLVLSIIPVYYANGFINYGLLGVILILSFYFFLKKSSELNMTFVVIILYLLNLNAGALFAFFSVLSLFIIFKSNLIKASVDRYKYFFIIFYPLHIFLLKLLSSFNLN